MNITRKQRLILKLFLFNLPRLVVFRDIEKLLDYKNPQPDLRLTFKELIEKEIFVFKTKDVLGFKKYKLNKNKLFKFIKNSELYKLVEEVMHKQSTLTKTPE